ncbi:uncharacterized protein LOC141599318 [Silene latifolia]|uniref:uncharacterized protein LOC141599318 n=1 Tax=Silene latifolia TaxID=37657 RepID=UPI003D77584C
MNRAYLDMLNCPNTTTGVKGMEMSVLERQNLVLKKQQEQLFKVKQPEDLSCYNDFMLPFLAAQAQDFQILNMECIPNPVAAGPTLNEIMNRAIKADPSIGNGWMDYGLQQSGVTVENSGAESAGQVNSPCYGVNYAISGTTSLAPIASVATTTMKMAHSDNMERGNLHSEQRPCGTTGREGKRKAEKSLMTSKVEEAEGNISKKSKGCPAEESSKITEQSYNRNSTQSRQKDSSGNNNHRKNKETSGCTSKDNSKNSQVQKTDYIHVRARRGQATDSHSLAERVRREKISERMRYLQDLVPGCSKITGKAGMLDEIINYVQSLQRQVEFLSMKLANASPSLDFNIDDLLAKEILAASSNSVPTMGVSPDLTNSYYLQYNPIQQIDPVCGPEVIATPIDMGLRRNISVPVSMPETCHDTSYFNHITNSLQWDAESQNIYMEFLQGRSTTFPFQTSTGTTDASNLKMEI